MNISIILAPVNSWRIYFIFYRLNRYNNYLIYFFDDIEAKFTTKSLLETARVKKILYLCESQTGLILIKFLLWHYQSFSPLNLQTRKIEFRIPIRLKLNIFFLAPHQFWHLRKFNKICCISRKYLIYFQPGSNNKKVVIKN